MSEMVARLRELNQTFNLPVLGEAADALAQAEEERDQSDSVVKVYQAQLAKAQERIAGLEKDARRVVDAYASYMGRGVSPARTEYALVVDAINRLASAVAPQEQRRDTEEK